MNHRMAKRRRHDHDDRRTRPSRPWAGWPGGATTAAGSSSCSGSSPSSASRCSLRSWAPTSRTSSPRATPRRNRRRTSCSSASRPSRATRPTSCSARPRPSPEQPGGDQQGRGQRAAASLRPGRDQPVLAAGRPPDRTEAAISPTPRSSSRPTRRTSRPGRSRR